MTNLGKHSQSSFTESEGITVLKRKLESKRSIKCFFSENDKTPNVDGFFELIKTDGTPIKRFNVQIKTTSELKNGKLSVDTKIMSYVLEKITADPTFLFIIDLSNEQVYFRHVTIEYILSINLDPSKKNITIDFNDDKAFNIDIFEKNLYRIAETHNKLITSKSDLEIKSIQEAINYLNETIFSIPELVATLIPNLHKVGIATSKEEKKLLFKSMNKEDAELISSNNYGVYFILKGVNRLEIEDLQNTENYSDVFLDGTGNITPMKYAEYVLSRMLKHFFNRTSNYIRFMPDIILNEVVFAFLDKLGAKYKFLSSQKYIRTFFKDEVEVEEAEYHLNKTLKYITYILHSDNLYQQEFNLRRIILDSIGSFAYSNGIDFIDEASTFVPREIFENISFKNDISKYDKKTMLSLLSPEYTIYHDAIKELNNRGIKRITRQWNFETTKENEIFLGNKRFIFNKNFYDQCKKWLENIPLLYEKTVTNLQILDVDIKTKVTCSINQDDYRPNSNFSANYYTQQNESFVINIVNEIDKDAIHKYGNSSYSSSIQNYLRTKMPMYYTIAGLLYKKIAEKYSLDYQGIRILSSMEKL